jgi:hypothetical protein
MTDTLQHVGVLGMRWGHRRGGSSRTGHPSSDHVVATKIKAKKLHEMSNDEIKTLSNRIQLERQYKDLNPSKVKRGAKAVGNTMDILGKIALGIGTLTTLAGVGKKIYDYANKVKK